MSITSTFYNELYRSDWLEIVSIIQVVIQYDHTKRSSFILLHKKIAGIYYAARTLRQTQSMQSMLSMLSMQLPSRTINRRNDFVLRSKLKCTPQANSHMHCTFRDELIRRHVAIDHMILCMPLGCPNNSYANLIIRWASHNYHIRHNIVVGEQCKTA